MDAASRRSDGAGLQQGRDGQFDHASSREAEKPRKGSSLAAAADLKRKLQSRHLQMIAIGGTIGTGLFIGSGGALASGGPASALLGYAFVGTIVYSVMVALGEMTTYIPVTGAFTSYAGRFVDPSLAFAMGWIYWFSWAITFALELTASGLIIQYWAPNIEISVFIATFWIIITAFNFLPVNFYGELEFWLCQIKIITIVGFMIFGICINAGAGKQGYIGFKYWHEPGAFAPYLLEQVNGNVTTAKFVGFWSVLIQAGFSYQGTELLGIAAGEADNPRKTVPAAIRKTFYRILFFFVLTVFFIGILIPYDNQRLLSGNTDASSSPFVIAADLAGVETLPSIINAVLLTVVLSAANSNVYCASRIIVGLAQQGAAPRSFTKTTKPGVPWLAVAFTSVFGLLGLMNESHAGGKVFGWFLNISAVAGFIAWTCIGISYLCFMRALRAQGVSRDTLPYKASWQPYFSAYGVFFNLVIILTQGFTSFMPWGTSNFFVAYVSLIIFAVLYVGHKAYTRQWRSFVKPEEADLDSGRREVEEMLYFEQQIPRTRWQKFWAWVG